jgi:hypothetical protein
MEHFFNARSRHAVLDRAVAAVVALACGVVLGIAVWVEPAPTGYGTHTQIIGLRACVWITAADLPCPTCGMTTAFAHAARGRFISSFLAQPMGFVLALTTATAFWLSLYIALTGSPLGRVVLRLWRPGVAWALGTGVLLSWLYKIWSFKGGGG